MNIKVGDFVKLKNGINYLNWYSSSFIEEYNKLGKFKVIYFSHNSDLIKVKSETNVSGYWWLESKHLESVKVGTKEERVSQKIKQMYSNSKVPLERKWAESMS